MFCFYLEYSMATMISLWDSCQFQPQRNIRRREKMEDQNISEFIKKIGKEIERSSGAKLNFPQESTIVKEEWITESEMMVMQENKRIHLRMAEQTKSTTAVELKRFNPSYLYAAYPSIPCRMPGCPETTKNLVHSRDKDQNKIKQDLFLCETHRKTLKDRVLERCAQEHVILDDASFKNDYFNGYTRLIGALEKAFVYLNSKWFKNSYSLLAEVFLNSRNFLIITNALLNPDEDNTAAFLAAFLTLLLNFLQRLCEDPDLMLRWVTVLRDITIMVLTSFGVIYNWVSLANPGVELGGGIGLVLGYAISNAYGSSWGKIITTTLVGLVGGRMVGSGVFNLIKQMKQDRQISRQIIGEYLYCVLASPDSDVVLWIEDHVE